RVSGDGPQQPAAEVVERDEVRGGASREDDLVAGDWSCAQRLGGTARAQRDGGVAAHASGAQKRINGGAASGQQRQVLRRHENPRPESEWGGTGIVLIGRLLKDPDPP